MTIEQLITLILDKGFAVAVAIFLLARFDPMIRQNTATLKELHHCIDDLKDKIDKWTLRTP